MWRISTKLLYLLVSYMTLARRRRAFLHRVLSLWSKRLSEGIAHHY